MRQFGPTHLQTVYSQSDLAKFLTGLERYQEAEPVLRACVKNIAVVLRGDWRMFDAESRLGGCLVELGRFEEAEKYLIRSHGSLIEHEKAAADVKARSFDRVISLYRVWGVEEKQEIYQAARERWSSGE